MVPAMRPWIVAPAICASLLACRSEPSRAMSTLSAAPLEADAPLPAIGTAPLDAIEALAKRYAGGYVPEGAVESGELAQGERRDFLSVLRYGHCYRILGAGGPGLTDLDLVLFTQAGVRVTQDPTQDPFPVLGLQSSICPENAGAYRIQAHAFAGAGPFALRVYRTGP
jgi:hypothetical protein